MIVATFWPELWPALVATIAGGGVVAGLGYWFLDRALDLRRRADRAKETAAAENAIKRSVLAVVQGELEFVAAQLDTYRQALANDSVPHPTFDTNGWTLLSQAHALPLIAPDASEKLITVYNRLRSFNERLDHYSDLTQGSTATLFHITAAASTNQLGSFPPQVQVVLQQYETFKTMSSDALRQRLTELEPKLHTAIDAAKAELGLSTEIPSANITYQLPTERPTIIPLGAVPNSDAAKKDN